MREFLLAESWWQFVVWAIACYFIGCFNFALFISKMKKSDITKMGSGNPGTMNMSREFGLKIGVITFLCDAFKGGIPALVSFFVYRNFTFAGTFVSVADFSRYFCGLFVIIGHIFPITMKFKGGKGIASTFGLFWFSLSCENAWWLAIGFALLWGIVFFIAWTEWGSLGSLLGVSGFSIIQTVIFLLRYEGAMHAYMSVALMMIFAINFLTWWAHRKNLARLFSGEEHHTSVKKLAKKK